MKPEAFDNVKDQIGFCGIWCGSCVVGNGALKELTSRYQDVIQNYGLGEWASAGFDFKEFEKRLASIQEVSVCLGCLNGGGRDNCEMRRCASSRSAASCCECNDFMECEHSGVLKKMREGAQSADLSVRNRDVDAHDFIAKEIDALRKRFPSCILLCGES